MNPSRLEGAWINLRFANPATEGGGGPSQPIHSLWALTHVSLLLGWPPWGRRGMGTHVAGRGPAARQPHHPSRVPEMRCGTCRDAPTWLALHTAKKGLVVFFFFKAATVLQT